MEQSEGAVTLLDPGSGNPSVLPSQAHARGVLAPIKMALPPIVELQRDYSIPTPEERLHQRLLNILMTDVPYSTWGPGKWSWWRLRQSVGGAVRTAEFRAAIDRLIAEGLVVETREEPLIGWTARHAVTLTSRWNEALPRPIVNVRGREDVLERFGIGVSAPGMHVNLSVSSTVLLEPSGPVAT